MKCQEDEDVDLNSPHTDRPNHMKMHNNGEFTEDDTSPKAEAERSMPEGFRRRGVPRDRTKRIACTDISSENTCMAAKRCVWMGSGMKCQDVDEQFDGPSYEETSMITNQHFREFILDLLLSEDEVRYDTVFTQLRQLYNKLSERDRHTFNSLKDVLGANNFEMFMNCMLPGYDVPNSEVSCGDVLVMLANEYHYEQELEKQDAPYYDEF